MWNGALGGRFCGTEPGKAARVWHQGHPSNIFLNSNSSNQAQMQLFGGSGKKESWRMGFDTMAFSGMILGKYVQHWMFKRLSCNKFRDLSHSEVQQCSGFVPCGLNFKGLQNSICTLYFLLRTAANQPLAHKWEVFNSECSSGPHLLSDSFFLLAVSSETWKRIPAKVTKPPDSGVKGSFSNH